MAKWSGRGIPPTRRKLHRWRIAQLKLREAELKSRRQEVSGLDASYRATKRAILNPDRFVTLWCSERDTSGTGSSGGPGRSALLPGGART